MLRFALFSLAVMTVLIIIFGCKMSSTHTHHVDSVSQAEQIMDAH